MTIHYNCFEVSKFESIGTNCRSVVTFRSDDVIVLPLKNVERTFLQKYERSAHFDEFQRIFKIC
jgi:hypothetical protein